MINTDVLLEVRMFLVNGIKNVSSPLTPNPSSIDFGFHSFRCSAPAIWNAIPLEIHSSPSIDIFKWNLKTHFFRFPPV
jgi:hypothetical protein